MNSLLETKSISYIIFSIFEIVNNNISKIDKFKI